MHIFEGRCEVFLSLSGQLITEQSEHYKKAIWYPNDHRFFTIGKGKVNIRSLKNDGYLMAYNIVSGHLV